MGSIGRDDSELEAETSCRVLLLFGETPFPTSESESRAPLSSGDTPQRPDRQIRIDARIPSTPSPHQSWSAFGLEHELLNLRVLPHLWTVRLQFLGQVPI